MDLFEQHSDFTPLTLDWIGADATVGISEASIQGMSTHCHIIVPEWQTIALLDTG